MNEQMIPLGEIAESLIADLQKARAKANPCVEAQIDQMVSLAQDYGNGSSRFKPGDLIMPRRIFGLQFPGPALVMEVLARPLFIQPETMTSNNAEWGTRPDMRIAVFRGGRIVPFWVESWEFEKMKEPPA